ncbi:MAG: D-alanine--D-alanine ligase [Gammaproteobacteria bacterium]|nr:MAG: D-alanine--D-alanine ligase [Gammaproteobacteria bacterium]
MKTADFKHVAVFCGGNSQEREISLQTGQAVYESLKRSGFNVDLVDTGRVEDIAFRDYDAAFVALHGRDGEDGKFQAVLEYHDIPYTGSGVGASSVSMNKWFTKSVWQSAGLNTPSYWITGKNIQLSDFDDVDLPVFVKPVNEGSSIGITHVENRSDLENAVHIAQQFDDTVLIEKAITGKEYTFSYLNGVDMPLIQLLPANGFYDFEAKYERDDTQYIVSPELKEDVVIRVKQNALLALQVVGIKGWGRVDFMIDENGDEWFIEVNSVPGLTSHSLVPKAAASVGVNFDQVCIRILETADHG